YPTVLNARIFPLMNLIKKMRENTPIEFPPGTVVVLLPTMYTGHSDRLFSPFGLIPGAHLIASLINSVLTGNWLSVMPHGWIAILFCGGLGFMVGLALRSSGFWLCLLGITAGLIGTGLWIFIQLRMEVPWLLGSANFFLTAFFLFAERTRVAERK